jgi:hypothetical protein
VWSSREGDDSATLSLSCMGRSALCNATSSSGDAVFFNSCSRCIADAMSMPGPSWTTDSCLAKGLGLAIDNGDALTPVLGPPMLTVEIAGGYRSLAPIVSVDRVESVDERRKESRDSFLFVSGKDCFNCCFKFFGASGRVLMSK